MKTTEMNEIKYYVFYDGNVIATDNDEDFDFIASVPEHYPNAIPINRGFNDWIYEHPEKKVYVKNQQMYFARYL